MAAFTSNDSIAMPCNFGRSGYNVPSGSGSGNGGENGGDKK
jgi:hypothetical protein